MGQKLPEILLCSRTYQPPQQTVTEDDIVLEGWLWRMISLSQKVSQLASVGLWVSGSRMAMLFMDLM